MLINVCRFEPDSDWSDVRLVLSNTTEALLTTARTALRKRIRHPSIYQAMRTQIRCAEVHQVQP